MIDDRIRVTTFQFSHELRCNATSLMLVVDLHVVDLDLVRVFLEPDVADETMIRMASKK